MVVPHNVFAKLPSYNPFVGTFHHAPSAGNRGAVYFSSDIVDMAELEERKKFRHHPLTGIFHSLPGYYDPLHKLASCRRVMTAEGIYSDTESLRSFVAMDITDSEDFASLQQPSHMNRMYSDSRCISNAELMERPRRFSDGDADPFFNGNKNSPNNKKDSAVEYHDESTDSDVDEDLAALEQSISRSMPLNVLAYMVAQCLGAVCGTGLVKAFQKAYYHKYGGGANQLALGYSKGTGLGAEIVGTFILVYTVFSATDPKRSARDSHVPVLAPLPIGFAVFMVHLATIPITGTGINPARSFGPAVILNHEKPWNDQWIFWVGPFVGAAIAAFYHQFILRAGAVKALGSFRSSPSV